MNNRDHAEDRSPRFDLTRRQFVQMLGAGFVLTVTGGSAIAQGRRGGEGAHTVDARLHVGEDGIITVLTGKVDVGQGSRTEISQAAAEELRVPIDRIRLVMADTALTPDDGITAGSRTTPSTLPSVRKGAAYARELLVALAAQRLQLPRESLQVADGVVKEAGSNRSVSYADLAKAQELAEAFRQEIPDDVQLTPVAEWKVMGVPTPSLNGRAIVTGAHVYPSDVVRPDMLYGKVLRPPSYGATLKSVDLAPAKAIEGVFAFQEQDFVACAAPTSFRAAQALEAVAKTAQWETAPHPSSKELSAYLRAHAKSAEERPSDADDIHEALASAAHSLEATYEVAYIQHVPMEPRAAVAEWAEGKVTVWTGTQRPDGVQGEVAEAVGLPKESVRVIVPDTGGGFGGKHAGDAAVEAARLAKAAGKPVAVHWTRAEELRGAYYRPAAVIDLKGALDSNGTPVAWEQISTNPGGAGIGCPYAFPKKNTRAVPSDSPMRQGSYRALAATANNFARECFIDELAAEAGVDPLEFRMKHLEEERIRNVLKAAADKFGWSGRTLSEGTVSTGCGMACGTEKGSVVAAFAEVDVHRANGEIRVKRICQAFECGPVINPANLRSQILGCIIMGLGGALKEAAVFEDGRLLTDSLREYHVPRMEDVPPIEIVTVERPDLPAVGAGETPIIAVAPALANAVYGAIGIRLRSMPLKVTATA